MDNSSYFRFDTDSLPTRILHLWYYFPVLLRWKLKCDHNVNNFHMIVQTYTAARGAERRKALWQNVATKTGGHDMETLSAVPALWERGLNHRTSGFPSQRATNAELCYFLCFEPEQVIEQTLEWPVNWEPMMFKWVHCNVKMRYVYLIGAFKKAAAVEFGSWQPLLFVLSSGPTQPHQ